jgi:hypothetical protein
VQGLLNIQKHDDYLQYASPSQSMPNAEGALFMLFDVWVDECAEAAEILFSRPSFQQHILTVSTTHPHAVIRGLATYSLALCVELIHSEANAKEPPNQNRTFLHSTNLLNLIVRTMTIETYKSNLTCLHTYLTSVSKLESSPWAIAQHFCSFEDSKHPSPQRSAAANNSSAGENEHSFATIRPSYTNFQPIDDHLSFSPIFIQRFFTVYERCDQRLLTIITTGSNPSKSPMPIPFALQFQSQSQESVLDSTNSSQHNQNEAAIAVLQTELNDARAQILSLQNSLSIEKQQREQLERLLSEQSAELARIKSVSAAISSSEKPTSNGTQSLNTNSNHSEVDILQQDLDELRVKYKALEAEHEDLLLLLAQSMTA